MSGISSRKLLVVAMATLLVALAGCNTGGTVEPTPTDTLTAGLDGQQLNTDTTAALEEAGSYTLQVNSSSDTDGPDGDTLGVTNQTTHVDLDANRGVRITEQRFRSGQQERTGINEVFTDGNTSYRRQNTSQGVFYDRQEGAAEGRGAIQPVNVSSYTQNYTVVTASFEWEENGTETIDGTQTVRYTSVNLTDSSILFDREDVTISNASAMMYVDEENVVRRVTLEYTLQSNETTTQFEQTITLSDIGSTPVKDPTWLSEAEGTETFGQ